MHTREGTTSAAFGGKKHGVTQISFWRGARRVQGREGQGEGPKAHPDRLSLEREHQREILRERGPAPKKGKNQKVVHNT